MFLKLLNILEKVADSKTICGIWLTNKAHFYQSKKRFLIINIL